MEQHEKSRSLDADVPRDFIDAYLDEVKQQSAKNPSTTFTCESLLMADVFNLIYLMSILNFLYKINN
jgi:hypothetical protein